MQHMRVLVVEDDRALGLFLQKGLKLDGHEVDWVGDGEAALEHAAANPPDLMVLDLSLPRRDGTEVLAEMQRQFGETSVLVLTGRSQVEERVKCLNNGADDCLLKPFSFHELSARCRAILRRRAQNTDSVLRFGGVEMDRLNRSVRREGFEVELTGKEFALLEYLLHRRGQCCDRAELLREVWQMPSDSGTNVVDVYINYLRRKLAAAHPDGASSAPVIETVRGQGYRLVGAHASGVGIRRAPASEVTMAMTLAKGA
jgi:DNA-binding response OmpR family regulator